MRRLIAVATAATLLLASVGVSGVLAGAPTTHGSSRPDFASHNLGHGKIFRVHVSPVVWTGSRLGFTATLNRCDGTTGVTVTVSTTDGSTGTLTTDITSGTATLKRVNNAHAKVCVWRSAVNVTGGTPGYYKVTFAYGSIKTAFAYTHFIDHTSGTDASSDTGH